FRLTEDGAVINRLGFNSEGIEVVRRRLAARRGMGVLGVNVGMNKDASDPVADYCRGIEQLGPFADYIVINASSPNTPGLRDLQKHDAARALIEAARVSRDNLGATPRPPLLLKIAPDLTPFEVGDLVDVAMTNGIDGIIVSNTTTARPGSLRSAHKSEEGGLSGKPLFEASTRLLAEVYRLTSARIPLIGVGGVASGEDAYAKIRAGATLVQLYSAMALEGPGLIARIKRELCALLTRDGFASVAAAAGADLR
ncbi:MAG TPA: dihydroorotate dehydrogenase (quinone), partial [Rhizomicrobium sp.]|nr:dihydroorotate dehydrogenase (quinone) [Rhizomicrobium sp.]